MPVRNDRIAAIAAYRAAPSHCYGVLATFDTVQRTVAQAWALLREAGRLGREDRTGRCLIEAVGNGRPSV